MNPRNAFAKGGLVGVACVACCAPPLILGLGLTAGLAAMAAVFLGLAVGVAVLLIGGGTLFARRRAHRPSSAAASVAVAIGHRPGPQPQAINDSTGSRAS